MNQVILTVEGLSKKFCRNLKRSLWYGLRDLAGELLLSRNGAAQLRQDEFWALKDISFELRRGETLGLIGPNGAGKSTLLKLINGLLRPDTGSIRIRGRVGALIELGAGFHPILTGRENIYASAAVLGMRRRELDRLLDEIVHFAEIGDFIDAPLQTYSSGMKVRLGFSVAAHLNPDLLLIDEILSVGDASFRQRCIDRLNDYKGRGGTILFVSHSPSVVETLSDRVMLLDRGRVLQIGDPTEVVLKYEAKALELSRQASLRLHQESGPQRREDPIRFTAVECYDTAGNRRTEFEFGESLEVRLHYETSREIHSPYFGIAIQKGELENPWATVMNMIWDNVQLQAIPRQGVVGCVIENLPFTPGVYRIYIGVQSRASDLLGEKWYARPREYASLTVLPDKFRAQYPHVPAFQLMSGLPPVLLAHSWMLNGKCLSAAKSSGSFCGEREVGHRYIGF